MISIQIILFVLTFAITYFLVPLNIKFSMKYNLLDRPTKRSIHKKNIPLAGGLSFATVITISELIIGIVFKEYYHKIFYLVITNVLIILFGLYDDIKVSSPMLKLIVQIILISLLYYGGFRISKLTNPLTDSFIELKLFTIPFTFVWFLVLINAINIIDGLDGLAAGIVFFSALVLIILGNMKHFFILSLISSAIAGSMLAFLKYNFYPAKIFMGDTGSLFLGLNLAAISIIGIGAFKRFTAMSLMIPISAMIVPLGDFVVTIFRRIKYKKNIMEADKHHFHHILLNLGFSQRTIAYVSYFITFLFGIITVGFSYAPAHIHFLVLMILFIIIFIGFYIINKEDKK